MPDTPKQGLAAPAPAGATKQSVYDIIRDMNNGLVTPHDRDEQLLRHYAIILTAAFEKYALEREAYEAALYEELQKYRSSVPAGGKERFCGVDLAKEPSFAVLQIMRFPGETDEQFRDRVNRALAELDSTRPAPTRKQANEEILPYGPRFFIVEMCNKKYVTRSVARPRSSRPLTRRELYDGRMGEAQREYAHAFMCTGFPTKEDPTRPTMEAWLAEEPFEFEVDKFVSEKLFGEPVAFSKENPPCL